MNVGESTHQHAPELTPFKRSPGTTDISDEREDLILYGRAYVPKGLCFAKVANPMTSYVLFLRSKTWYASK